jgi:hypothetical protein
MASFSGCVLVKMLPSAALNGGDLKSSSHVYTRAMRVISLRAMLIGSASAVKKSDFLRS